LGRAFNKISDKSDATSEALQEVTVVARVQSELLSKAREHIDGIAAVSSTIRILGSSVEQAAQTLDSANKTLTELVKSNRAIAGDQQALQAFSKEQRQATETAASLFDDLRKEIAQTIGGLNRILPTLGEQLIAEQRAIMRYSQEQKESTDNASTKIVELREEVSRNIGGLNQSLPRMVEQINAICTRLNDRVEGGGQMQPPTVLPSPPIETVDSTGSVNEGWGI
jgi:methyl-accepting chemotaxis protein